MDPLEFRLKNLLKKGELYTPGDTPVDCDLKAGLLQAAEAIGWGKSSKANRGKGLAFAAETDKRTRSETPWPMHSGMTCFSQTRPSETLKRPVGESDAVRRALRRVSAGM